MKPTTVTQYTVIDTPEALDEARKRLLDGVGPIAVDTERASGFRYSQRAYLIQLFRRGSGTFLIDPPAFGRLDALEETIGAEEWVLHAASQDLPCLREVGLEPATLFDTELASRLLGMPRVGLGTVVEELLGVHLAKAYSAVDWSTRPLPQSWLTYAALDVEFLIDLKEAIEELLTKAGKGLIAAEEFQAELSTTPAAPRAERWRRLSGIHAVKGRRRLAIARALWRARDDLARDRDIAPGRLIPDSALVAAAVATPASLTELLSLPGFTGRASRKQAGLWWAALEEGRTTEDLPTPAAQEGHLPPTRSWKHHNPEAAARLEAAKAALRTVAEDHNIPLENLLRPATLRALAWEPPEERTASTVEEFLTGRGAREWQRELVTEALSEALQATPGDVSHEVQATPA
jgi:ribonuclease D